MPHPTPPSSLGNPRPPHVIALPLPTALTEREGLVVPLGGRDRLPVDLSACAKILVVRLDFIGDWVLMSPFLANLRKSAPGAEIMAIVLNRVFDLARACRFVDRVIGVDAAVSGPVEFCASDRGELAAFAREYLGGAFDLALVPRWDTDFNGALRIADGSGARQIVGFSEACTEQRQVLNRGDDRFYSAVLLDRDEVHEVEHKLSFLEALGGAVEYRDLSLDLSAADEAAANGFVREHVGEGRRFLAVAPFAAGRKQLAVERTAELTRRLRETLGLPVVVIGSPVHEAEAAAFVGMVGGRAISAVGLPLAVSAALIGRAALLVGMDSGPAHIAAALDTPVAVIFNHPRSGARFHVGSPGRFAPWGDPARLLVVQPEVPLAPCVDGCEADAAHCIDQLDVDDIWPTIARFATRPTGAPVAAKVVASPQPIA